MKPNAQTQRVLAAMDANATQVTTMLDGILKRLDEQMVAADKRYEEQQAFNSTLSKELQGVQKQLDLTQKEVDATRKEAASSPAPSVTSLADLRSGGASSSMPLMTTSW